MHIALPSAQADLGFSDGVAGAVIAFLLHRRGKPAQGPDAAPVVHM
ncbi:hypothetical protein [Streptomyces sp. 142MFCol3.1]|nr:hypothetical protein [Streptomyces sp. 142MFCol3.1]